MKNVLALVLAGGRVDELSVLTLSRPKSAVPFGGMYRVIDFCLSNLMHSGVERVGILSQYRSYSLINHIGIGASWDFVGRDRGATLLLPSVGDKAPEWYKGGADAVYQNLEFIQELNPEWVIVLSGDHVYKMDYNRLFAAHQEREADLTIAFAPVAPEQSHRFGVAEIDADSPSGGWVTDYREKPPKSTYRWASLTIYVFKAEVLYQVLSENSLHGLSYEFGRHIIPSMLGRFNIYGYLFDGYWGYTRTLREYWNTSMDLLGDSPKIDLEGWQVRTNLDHDRLRDRPPARIGAGALVDNSLVYSGCEVEGEVRDSILFPGVRVARGAKVTNSILFFDGEVEQNAVVDRVIADFDVRVGPGCHVGEGDAATANLEFPDLLNFGITLIGKGAAIPSGRHFGRNCIIAPGVRKFDDESYPSGVTVR